MTVLIRKGPAGQIAAAIRIGRHELVTDLPAAAGGDDLGPDPHDLFDASLAACTSLTVTLYARRKGWPLQDVRVSIERDASEEQKGSYRLLRTVELVGDLDESQRARLVEIAERCPIHRLMHASIDIQTHAGPVAP